MPIRCGPDSSWRTSFQGGARRGAESSMNDRTHSRFPACRSDACSCGDQPCPDPAACSATGIETATVGYAIVVVLALLAVAFVLPMGAAV